MKAKNVCDLPGAGTLTDDDGILIMQGGKALKMTMPQFRQFLLLANVSEQFGFPTITAADAGKALTVNEECSGYELITAAPGGYGYGGSAIDAGLLGSETELEAALDELLAGMANTEAKQVRFILLNWVGDFSWVGTLYKSSTAYASLSVFSCYADHTTKVTKAKIAGVWKPFEWENPPLQLGVEYRTTKKFRNKTVYVKTIDFGALPNNSHKSIVHNLTKTAVVSLSACSTDGKYYFPSASNNDRIDLYINAANIVITTTADWSSVNAYVTVEYTKD